MFVRSSVRLVLVCLELLIFIFWHQICHDDFRMTSVLELTLFIFLSQVSQRSNSGQSQVSLCLLRQKDGA